jgi:hypothetical protein
MEQLQRTLLSMLGLPHSKSGCDDCEKQSET